MSLASCDYLYPLVSLSDIAAGIVGKCVLAANIVRDGPCNFVDLTQITRKISDASSTAGKVL